MQLDLIKYMSDRLQQEDDREKEPGPVITISREYGCSAKNIAEKICEELTKKMYVKGVDKKWKYVTKEIMHESAKQLNIDPSKIKYVFDYEQKSIIDDILAAHSSKYYKSDRKIRNTVARVVRNMAYEGHVIIIGRGGVAITRDIPKSLHINFEAPLEWRALRVSEKYDMTIDKAARYALDVDKKRKHFREFFEGKNTDYTRFDLTFNCMTLSVDEIASIVVKAVEARKLI